MSCSMSDCEKKQFSMGLCSMHYFREKRGREAARREATDRKRRSDAGDLALDYDDFWEFVKKELKIGTTS